MSLVGEFIFALCLNLVVDPEILAKADWGDPRMTLTFIFISQVFYFLLSFMVFLRLSGDRFEDLVQIDRISWRPLLMTLGVLVILFISSPLLSGINELIRPFLPVGLLDRAAANAIAQQELFYQSNFIQFGFSLIVFALLPAIFEELVFRGFLISKMIASGISETGAILMSGAIFAVSHMQPLNLLVMFFAGVCLGFVYMRFKNIKYSMILHFFFNAVQIVIGYLVGSGILEMEI